MERRDSGLLALGGGGESAGDWRSGLRGQEAQARGGGVISVIENEWGGWSFYGAFGQLKGPPW